TVPGTGTRPGWTVFAGYGGVRDESVTELCRECDDSSPGGGEGERRGSGRQSVCKADDVADHHEGRRLELRGFGRDPGERRDDRPLPGECPARDHRRGRAGRPAVRDEPIGDRPERGEAHEEDERAGSPRGRGEVECAV